MDCRIEEYKIEPIYATGDYGRQAIRLRDKILEDVKLLSKNPSNDAEKWEWRNCYSNIYTFWCLLFEDIFDRALAASLSDNSYNEKSGWFIYPRTSTIKLGNAYEYKTVDEYNTALYSKYFDRYFSFKIADERVNSYFEEAKELFKEGKYYSCVCSLFPIIEYLSRNLSSYSSADGKFSQFKALNKIVEKIPKQFIVPLLTIDYFTDEYKKIKDFMLDNYYQSSKQEDDEPKYVCRHRLLHGIITRDVSAADCLRLFLIIRSFVHLAYLFKIGRNLIKYHRLVLQTEDKIIFGEDYEEMMQEFLNN